MLARLRAAAASPDAFVYGAAIFVLHELGLPLPYFRGSTNSSSVSRSTPDSRGGGLPADPSNWTIEQVVQWVSGQSFRAYRQAFRSQLVNGQMLLELTDEDCAEALGMASRLHRRAVLLAVQRLREAHDAGDRGMAGDGGKDAGPGAMRTGSGTAALRRGMSVPQMPDAPMFDCFISYRRAGGADFALLLKVRKTRDDTVPLACIPLSLWSAAPPPCDHRLLPSTAGVPRVGRPDVLPRRG